MSNAFDPFYDDSDRHQDRCHCKHGTFIGNPYGADYLCGWCEDGTSDEEYQEWIDGEEDRRVTDALTRLESYDKTVRILEDLTPERFGALALALEDFANANYFCGVVEVLDRNNAWPVPELVP